MAIFRHTVVLRMRDGFAPNDCVNVWHSVGPDIDQEEYADDVNTALVAFYQSFDAYLARDVDPTSGAHIMKHAIVDPNTPGGADDTSGSSILEAGFSTPGITVTESLPREVAVALSMNGVLTDIPEESGGIRPAARRRGRVFIGPLSQDASEYGAVDLSSRPAATFVGAVLDAAEELAGDVVTAGGALCVYSRTAALTFEIVRFTMDDAFDTIRSRGNEPINRASRVLA